VLHVTSNFRSCEEIVRHINLCFEAPLRAQETGYVALKSTRGAAAHGLPCVVKVKIDAPARVADIRDEEARVVAETCARLIGNITLRRGEGSRDPLRPEISPCWRRLERTSGATSGRWRKPDFRSARRQEKISSGVRKRRT